MITIYDGVSMVGSFVGIILIALSAPKVVNETAEQSNAYIWGVVCSVVSALFLSFVFVSTSKMKSIHYLVISFYLGVLSGLMCTVGMIIQFLVDGRRPF